MERKKIANLRSFEPILSEQTQTFKKIYQDLKLATDRLFLLLEPFKDRETAHIKLPNGRVVVVKLEDEFEDLSGPQDVNLEWTFKQENGKQLTVQERIIKLQMAHAMVTSKRKCMDEDQICLAEIL